MTQGQGGWVLELHCVTCGAGATYRGVLLTLAADRAIADGWDLETSQQALAAAGPGQRQEVCPRCARALAG